MANCHMQQHGAAGGEGEGADSDVEDLQPVFAGNVHVCHACRLRMASAPYVG